MEVLTPEKFASIKSRLDGRKIRTMQQLAEFHKLVVEMIYQRKKRCWQQLLLPSASLSQHLRKIHQ